MSLLAEGAEGLLSGDTRLLGEPQDEPGHLSHGHCTFWPLSLCLATYFRLIANISLENGPALPCPHHTQRFLRGNPRRT